MKPSPSPQDRPGRDATSSPSKIITVARATRQRPESAATSVNRDRAFYYDERRRLQLPCHVCGSRVGVTRPLPEVEPTCSRNECLGATAGIISLDEARRQLRARGVKVNA